MKNLVTIILLSLLSLTVWADDFDSKGWQTYLSYHTTNCVEESADKVFVVAEGSLYTYGKEDNSIVEFHKGKELSDNTISLIRYNNKTKSLLVVYDNSNIDILKDGISTNLPYLFNNTSIGNKQINDIYIYDKYAYVSTAFGIIVIDMEKEEIKDTFNLSYNITSCAILNGYIYASTTEKDINTGIIYAPVKENLADKSNWKTYNLANIHYIGRITTLTAFNNTLFFLVKYSGIHYEKEGALTLMKASKSIKSMKVLGNKLACLDDSNLYLITNDLKLNQVGLSLNDISTHQTNKYWIAEGTKGLRSIEQKGSDFAAINEPIILNGPCSNNSYDMVFQNDKLYMIIGGKNLLNGKRFGNDGYVLTYDYDKWSYISPTEVKDKLNKWPRDYTSIVITKNEKDEEVIYTSSLGDGIFEYKNNVPYKKYDYSNVIKETAANSGSGYNFMDGLALDKLGNLWMTNSEVNHAVVVMDKDKKWHYLDIPSLKGLYTINDIFITSKNDKWINVPRVTPKLVLIPDGESLDNVTSYEFTSFIDTDGKVFNPSNYTCVTEDKDGFIWIGTNRGAIYLTRPRISTNEDQPSIRCTRVKYMNEEAGNLTYFLDNVTVTTIKVDAGNRKWIGTKGNGVFVLDNNNEDLVYQFNTSNSPLLSNNIYDIEINNKTGEVFIGTDKGLNSFMGEVSEGKEDYSEIYAYPNPVRPEHMDKVNIVGLMDNSNVKITDISGNIIYQTKSLGGQATWNCRNANGSRVASGVYLVLASTEEGGESVVTKIMVVK